MQITYTSFIFRYFGVIFKKIFLSVWLVHISCLLYKSILCKFGWDDTIRAQKNQRKHAIEHILILFYKWQSYRRKTVCLWGLHTILKTFFLKSLKL